MDRGQQLKPPGTSPRCSRRRGAPPAIVARAGTRTPGNSRWPGFLWAANSSPTENSAAIDAANPARQTPSSRARARRRPPPGPRRCAFEAPPPPRRRPEYQRQREPARRHRRGGRRLLDAVLEVHNGVDELLAAAFQNATADQPREDRPQHGAADRRQEVRDFLARRELRRRDRPRAPSLVARSRRHPGATAARAA